MITAYSKLGYKSSHDTGSDAGKHLQGLKTVLTASADCRVTATALQDMHASCQRCRNCID